MASPAPHEIRTARLLLHRPAREDARQIFSRYASDALVCRYLAWPRHETLDATRAFLDFSDRQWAEWPAGPYLVSSLEHGRLLGSTGLAFESLQCASTGYVLAADAWGQGYATEALAAIRDLARDLGVTRLYACIYPDHTGSRRVLEKCGFEFEGILERHCEFPNLLPGIRVDVASYAWTPKAGS